MIGAGGMDDLYQGWYDWAVRTLGNDPQRAAAAATAARDEATAGDGFNAAVEAARKSGHKPQSSATRRQEVWPKNRTPVIRSLPKQHCNVSQFSPRLEFGRRR